MDIIPKIIALYFLVLLVAVARHFLKRPICPQCKNNLYTKKKWIITAVCNNHSLLVKFNTVNMPKFKNFVLYFFLLGLTAFLGLIIGCVPNQRTVIIYQGSGLPPQPSLELSLPVINRTNYTVSVTLIRPDDYKSTTFMLGPHTEALQPLSKGGRYKAVITCEALGLTGWYEVKFDIIPGKFRNIDGVIVGDYLIIEPRRFKWNNNNRPSKIYFGGNGNYLGETTYNRNGNHTKIETPTNTVKIKSSGIPALILRWLTR